jgi:hypothetical protein
MVAAVTTVTILDGVILPIVDSPPFKTVKQLASPIVHRVHRAHASEDNVSTGFAADVGSVSVEMCLKVAPNEVHTLNIALSRGSKA